MYSKRYTGKGFKRSLSFAVRWQFLVGYTLALVILTAVVVGGICRLCDENVDQLRVEIGTLKQKLSSAVSDRDWYKTEYEELMARPTQKIVSADRPESRTYVPAVSEPQSGKCKIYEGKSPIDDSPDVNITCESEEKFDHHDNAKLVVRYLSRKAEVFVVFNEYLGNSPVDVTYRFDSLSAESSKWSLSTDSCAAFFTGSVFRFVSSLASSSKLVIQVTPYSESTRLYTFDVSNFGRLVSPIRHYFN